jgi:RNA polymerase sigma-70 factor (ECF subfamily)
VVSRPRDDSTLVLQAVQGDVSAYEELVRMHQEIAFRVAYVVCGNAADAEEAAQDGFVKAYRALGRFRAGAQFRPWLLHIVANEARTRKRSAVRRERLVLRAVALTGRERGATSADAAPSPEAALLEAERRTVLLDGLGRLTDDDQDMLVCRYLLDLGEEETAAALGLRRGTVKSRTFRALERLRAMVGEEART